MEHYENIELRSPDVQEILGTPPRWLWRWGTVIVFICFTILVVFSYILKYPDIIQAPVILTTKNPPQSLTARVEGRVAQYLVEDGDKVKAGQLLAILQNPANLKDVYRLDSLVRKMQM
jgi:multidrug efflux pump subunit AcrA (membrane-fusion protein)